ncbi:hypothetical protein LIER_41317 [Lithospermum erythrorhizon]|uniref:Reverse transcriptase zinc-binding domain-containing protein n=1 Tax=Lithospermum erythrorhizon TaxID=34254 RepID=A0AAV3R7N2_LITER
MNSGKKSLEMKWPKGRHFTQAIQDLIGRHFTRAIQDLIVELPNLRLNVQDRVEWKGYGSMVKAATIWTSLSHAKLVPPWTKLLWWMGHIPNHSFVCWVLCQGRLPTKDRLIS